LVFLDTHTMRQLLLIASAFFAVFTAHATIHTVTVSSNFFSPNTLTIQAGDTVVWNCVSGCHNVNGNVGTFPSNPASFGNSVACSPWVYAFTFSTTGTYNYQCDPHAPGMSGTITVNAATPPVVIPNVWINEIHYDNVGTDVNEGYEIAGPAGTNLACYKVYLYNGTGGVVYDTDTLSGVIPNTSCGFGAVWFATPATGFQNGAPDGIVLEYAPQATGCGVNNADTILQLLSYEGSFSATSGRAAGLSLTDIGVTEGSSTDSLFSLQLGGAGTSYSQFTWQSATASTHNAVNNNQYFCGAPVSTYKFTTTALTVSESAGTVVAGYVKATNVFAPSQTVEVALKTGSSADVNGYTTQTLNFTLNGVDSLPFNITITDDALLESAENLVFALRNPSTGSIAADSLFTLTITDNDVAAPVVQFLLSSSSIAENLDSIQIPVSITNPVATATTVDIMIMGGGTATSGTDYSYAPATITFPANSSTNQYLTVYIQNDLFAEGNETATFMLMNASGGASIGTNGMHTLTITDDDAQQIIIPAATVTQPENGGTVLIGVSLNNPAATATSVTLQLSSAGTTATNGSDFVFADTTITWAASASGLKQVPLQIINDNLYEFSETVKVKLINQTSGVFLTDTNFVLTITDNDQLSFADCSDLFFSEYVEGSSNNKALEIYNPTAGAISLSDYRIFKSTNGGSSTQMFNLSGTVAAGDVYVLVYNQADSLLKLKADTLSSFLNFNGDDALALLHLNDTIDIIGQIGLDPGNGWVVGNGSTADNSLIRNYYTYEGNTNWLIASNTWNVHPVDMFDSLGFHHTAPCGTVQPAPPATIRFVGTTATVAEGLVKVNVVVETVNPSGQNANFVIARDDAASTATAGNDYTYTNQTLSRGAGTTYDTVQIDVLEDNLIESSETVLLRFINVSSNVEVAADSVYILTITDSDVLSVGFVGAGFSYVEDTNLVAVRLALSTPHSDTVRVTVSLGTGNATAGSDFIFNDTIVTFLPNSSDTQAVWVTIIDDNIHEVNEQINLNLSSPTGGAVLGINAYTVTIIDNDPSAITDADFNANVKLFPNPVSSFLTIQTTLELPEVVITNVAGSAVLRMADLPVGTNMLELNNLSEGLYFVTIRINETAVTRKLVKTH
jgi:plastocyanin